MQRRLYHPSPPCPNRSLTRGMPPSPSAERVGGERRVSRAPDAPVMTLWQLHRRAIRLALAAFAVAILVAPTSASSASDPPAILCELRPGLALLPPGARRGLIDHLRQYAAPALATRRQRAAARRLLSEARAASEHGRARRCVPCGLCDAHGAEPRQRPRTLLPRRAGEADERAPPRPSPPEGPDLRQRPRASSRDRRRHVQRPAR